MLYFPNTSYLSVRLDFIHPKQHITTVWIWKQVWESSYSLWSTRKGEPGRVGWSYWVKKGSYESGEDKTTGLHREGIPGRKSFINSSGDLCSWTFSWVRMNHYMKIRKIPSAGERPTQKEKRKWSWSAHQEGIFPVPSSQSGTPHNSWGIG